MFSHKQELLQTICQLAREGNEAALIKMQADGICFTAYYGGDNAVDLLAREGNHQAVEFMVDKFGVTTGFACYGYACGGYVDEVNALLLQGANRAWAVRGYACGGHVNEVNALLLQGANRDWAVSGYAQEGHVNEVNALLLQGANRDLAVFGYACGGHVNEVNALLLQGANRDWAVTGYAYGGHVNEVNALLLQGANRDLAVFGYARSGHVEEVNALVLQGANRDCAVSGYEHGGNVRQENIFYLMASTDDASLRGLLAQELKKQGRGDVDVPLREKAGKFNRIMRECSLSFQQAPVLTEVGTRAWLLQGPEMIRSSEKMIEGIFWKITMMLTGLSFSNAKAVFDAVHEQLFNSMKKDINSMKKDINSFSLIGFFRSEEKKKQIDAAETRYNRRKSFSKLDGRKSRQSDPDRDKASTMLELYNTL